MIGIAYRMALGLGMHREVTQLKQNTLQVERRRLLFWVLFCFDSGLSITTGRPTTSIEAFVDLRIPQNFDESVSIHQCYFTNNPDFNANCTCQMLDLDEPVPPEVNYPTNSSALIAQTKLAAIANEIHTIFWSVKTPQVETNHDVALTMEVRLFHWRNSLPRYFTSSDVPDWFLGPRAIVLWKEQNLRILLWRSSQRRHLTEAGKSVAILKSYATAIETIKDISVFCKENRDSLHMGINWYATYFIFQALLVLEVSRFERSGTAHSGQQHGTPNEDTSWMEAVEEGRRCLELLDRPNSTAGRCIQTLDRLRRFDSSSAGPMSHGTTSDYCDGSTSDEMKQVMETNSVSDVITPDALANQWTMSADPSLQMLLTDRQMDDLFRSVDGFPGTLDQDSFNYMAGWSFEME